MKNKLTNTESLTVNGVKLIIDYDDYNIIFAEDATENQILETIDYLKAEGFIDPRWLWHGGGCTAHAKLFSKNSLTNTPLCVIL